MRKSQRGKRRIRKHETHEREEAGLFAEFRNVGTSYTTLHTMNFRVWKITIGRYAFFIHKKTADVRPPQPHAFRIPTIKYLPTRKESHLCREKDLRGTLYASILDREVSPPIYA